MLLWRAARALRGVRAETEGAGLDQLGQEEGGVPQVVAEEAAVVVAVRGGQADVEGPGEVGRLVEEGVVGVAIWEGC